MAARRIKNERFARILLGLIILGLPLGVFLWGKNTLLPGLIVHASIPEDGGWMPGTIYAEAGKPITLRFTSEDVVHGFAIGQLDHPEIEILPGEFSQTTITFSEPGRYVYYCTRWCSPDHWRMRGTIIVEGPSQPQERTKAPLYVVMGIDIDQERSTDKIPLQIPSANDGRVIMGKIEGSKLEPYQTIDYLRSNSPAGVWLSLREESFTGELSDQDIWNLIAALWRFSTTGEIIKSGGQLFSQNCASCHGLNGDGGGIFAGQFTSGDLETPVSLANLSPPADFTYPEQMLASSSVILQGKIIRGGMGTGMPNFGPILTEERIWSLVNFIWTFQFSD
ncbi:MAG: c-type cytochrome [Anaerolineales bacterium]